MWIIGSSSSDQKLKAFPQNMQTFPCICFVQRQWGTHKQKGGKGVKVQFDLFIPRSCGLSCTQADEGVSFNLLLVQVWSCRLAAHSLYFSFQLPPMINLPPCCSPTLLVLTLSWRWKGSAFAVRTHKEALKGRNWWWLQWRHLSFSAASNNEVHRVSNLYLMKRLLQTFKKKNFSWETKAKRGILQYCAHLILKCCI